MLGTETVHLMDVAPARGGGFSAIEVGPWTVRDRYRSPAIAGAASALERVPGLVIERHEGNDV
ncbi:MAG TPA: hypothetical protein VEC14_08125 [Reyranellaceae bacterium]|nr:hypothetical protein [Reyranellaceae bacterium]